MDGWNSTHPHLILQEGEYSMNKPKDIKELHDFIYHKLKEEYGDNVISEESGKDIVVVTDTSYFGNNDVWIKLDYFN